MGINSLFGASVQGVQQGIQGLRRVASEIAKTSSTQEPTKPSDLSRTMVEMQQHAIQAKASSKALKISSETIGTLFDDHA